METHRFISVYNTFIKNNSRIDVFNHMLRANYKNSKNHGDLKIKVKQMDCFKDIDIINPFELRTDLDKTKIQLMMETISHSLKYVGSFAFSCSCGSGKTLAGIYLSHLLGMQTLIISARGAINDQWKNIIEKLYPDKIIETLDGQWIGGKKLKKKQRVNRLDVSFYIYSPQFLYKDINLFPSTCGLVIYDEIHSLLSKEFAKVLAQPLNLVLMKKIDELPYMLALSATYPLPNDPHSHIITKIFGTVIQCSTTIIDIPIYVYDIRDHTNDRGRFDNNYDVLDDYELIRHVINDECEYYNDNIHTVLINRNDICGYIITSTIDSSIYAWLQFYNKYKNKCILIRDQNEGCYEIFGDIPDEILMLGSICTFKDIKLFENKFFRKIDNYTNADIVFGTYHRLKEGISIENATWGICTKFIYSISARIQILGRIRRYSLNDNINNTRRSFIVNSGKVPTNMGELFAMRRSHKHKSFVEEITYNFVEEAIAYKNENYVLT